MFTGLIEDIGVVTLLAKKGGDIQLDIKINKIDSKTIKIGDSVAVNGVCLTVIKNYFQVLSFDVSIETINHSSLMSLKIGSFVNLEQAMLLNSRFGGHIVTGHIDVISSILQIQKSARSIEIYIKLPKKILKYIVKKGSVCVDGISLTINDVSNDYFVVNIIPHTAEHTIISEYKIGSIVNLEIDTIARYIENIINFDKKESNSLDKKESNLTYSSLNKL